MLKKYKVSWDEHYFVKVEAKDEKEAWEKAIEIADENDFMDSVTHNKDIEEVKHNLK